MHLMTLIHFERLYSNIMDLKWAVRSPGYFAGTFAGRYICLERLIVVILLHAYLIRVSLRLHRLVPRGKLDYLSVLSMPFTLPRM